MRTHYPLILGARFHDTPARLEVRDKFTGEVAATTALADEALLDEAVAKACAAADSMRDLPAYRRREILDHCVRRFEERAEELAMALCVEAGKPIRDARGEATRLVDTFRAASHETSRSAGEVMTMDITPRAQGYRGWWKRVPIGPCAFITPFNFPLNLVAHKVAPAIAAGCPFVLKPASATPIGALIVGETLIEAGMPDGSFSVVPCPGAVGERLVTDERIKLVSFTGSASVGWALKVKCGKKKIALELGGNAACVVDRDADIEDAAARIVVGAFYQSGQSCISVQRIFVHADVHESFREILVGKMRALVMGDPKDEATFIGPMISEAEAHRVDHWVQTAVGRGARLLCGGGRDGAMMSATLLENVPDDEPLFADEAFGPVAILEPFTDFDAALRRVNASRFGLQAGVFTRDIDRAMRAWDRLEVGGVVIGDVPSWRVDHMPYGGVKDSGLGREGIRFAIEEMTEVRLMALRGRRET
ncbi:MAG: aldehyde dehydrogenase family protein [Deltaproteobacteria bacterium]|nr:aldehyde dehydrogenase family protein [Deltaproteobacteria bacterium]